MPNPIESIKLILFVLGLALLCMSFVVYWEIDWRYAPACVVGWILCWCCVHLIYWFDQVFELDYDYCDPCSGVLQ
jgi:hypothetical protein